MLSPGKRRVFMSDTQSTPSDSHPSNASESSSSPSDDSKTDSPPMLATGEVSSLVDLEPELYPAAVYLVRASCNFPDHLEQIVESSLASIGAELKSIKCPPPTTQLFNDCCKLLRRMLNKQDARLCCARLHKIAEATGENIERCPRCFKPIEHSSEEIEAMQASFRVPIMDPDSNCIRALRFFLYCSVNGAGGKYYSKSCAIVQSSGSGKSRMITTLAEMLPVIYICERKDEDTGYPHTLVKIFERLGDVSPEAKSLGLSDLYIYLRCVAFFQTSAKFAAAVKMLVSLKMYVTEPCEIGHLLFG